MVSNKNLFVKARVGNRGSLLAWDEVLVYKGIPEMPVEMETAQGQVDL